ncbi:MAG: AcrR family transcriptional regulator [Patiriisocius sp.]|jgi:AcrR family transcriptional regulator
MLLNISTYTVRKLYVQCTYVKPRNTGYLKVNNIPKKTDIAPATKSATRSRVKKAPEKKKSEAAKASKERLNRQRIVQVAIDFADSEGLEALSMRSLGKELGFGVMSLYNHVDGKEGLLGAMVDVVSYEIELPEYEKTSDTWKKDLSACMISAYAMMRNHRWVSGLWNRPPGAGKNRYHEGVLRIMRNADIPEELSCRGFHALTMHVVGFAMQVLDLPYSNQKELRALGHKAYQELDETTYPFLREHIRFHLDGRDKRSDFKYMLDLILDGLERDFISSVRQGGDHQTAKE